MLGKKVSLNALFKSSILYILRSDINILIDNVCHSGGDKEYLVEALYCGFSRYRDMCDLDLYFRYL